MTQLLNKATPNPSQTVPPTEEPGIQIYSPMGAVCIQTITACLKQFERIVKHPRLLYFINTAGIIQASYLA